ncbi:MAG: NUDIX hydrolase [Nanobdellota archaeon]
MTEEQIIIVDKNDKPIGHKERGTLNKDDIYRVSALWVNNSKGDILLAQRAFTKRNHPGKWGPAVAGTNDKGESYESNIIKEAEEEINLTDFEMKTIFKEEVKKENHYFCQWFIAKVDKSIEEFEKQDEEVERIKWFSQDEIRQIIKEKPNDFLPILIEKLELFLSYN